MKITKEQFIKALNKDLELEYGAAVQYVQHASLITEPKYRSISKEFLIHSDEEMGHAKMISNIIMALGGVPTVDVEKRFVSSQSKVMLKQDLAGEELAIKRYKERIAQSEALQEYGARRILEDILMQEEEHRRDILGALGK